MFQSKFLGVLAGQSKQLLHLKESLDTIVHVLHELYLGAAKSLLVGNVVNVVGTLAVLPVDPSDLHVGGVGHTFENLHLFSQVWEAHVDRRSHTGANVGRARRQIPKSLVVGKFDNFLDLLAGSGETREHCTEIRTLLHGDDSELVFLVDPNEERLLVVVENATTLRPVPVETRSLQETISLLEKEVVFNKRFPIGV